MSEPDAPAGESARRPSYATTNYAVRAPLARWLESEAARAAERYGRFRVLDVGCGVKPYLPLFRAHASEYVGVDVDNPAADIEGSAESLPVEDGSFDVVLCTQTLEHCLDPAGAVRELRRVVAGGGRVLASTHGVQVYHPAPEDLWRWTHSGLERLFSENGGWSAVSVRPGSGTTACVAMLVAYYVHHVAGRVRAQSLGRGVIWALNRGAEAIDRRSPLLCEPRPGTIHANYHVVAEAP
jgi:SAM-dependent methyltransferase